MEPLILVVFALFGVVIGSFLNVVLLRIRTGSLFKKSSSFCLSCTSELRSIDLIPLLSYLNLRGRCRFCGSRYYDSFFVELFTALLFALSYVFFGLTIQAVLFCILFAFLVLISFYDLRHMIVPDEFSIPWNIGAFASIFISGNIVFLSIPYLLNHLLAGILLSVFFFAIWYFSKGRAMGFADGIIALGIGFILGLPDAITALLLSFWIGAGVSLLLMLFGRYGRRFRIGKGLSMKSEIPFGPYLALGFLITLLTNVSLF